MSLEFAETLSTLANWMLIFSLVIGVISTFAIVYSGNIKESYSKFAIAEANAQAAKANERAAEAALKLEELRRQTAPRQLQRNIFLKEIKGQPTANVEIMYLRDDP